jgi:TPR repeat protein
MSLRLVPLLAAILLAAAPAVAQDAAAPAPPAQDSPPAAPAPAPTPAAPEPAPAKPESPPPDIAFGAYQRGMFLTAFKEATKRLEANADDTAAMALLAELYTRGLGVNQDWEKAASWYKLAAQRGNKRAAYDYAMLLMQGTGVKKDPDEARRLLEQASETVPQAAYSLGLLLLSENSKEGDQRAVTLFRRAVGGMEGDAEYALAVLYRQGRGVQRDPNQAAVWMARAAAARNPAAELEYGIMLFNGEGVERDEKLAARYFRRAAEKGNALAQNRLARLYAAGRGIDQNTIEAAKWHIIARSKGIRYEWLDQVVRDLPDAERAKAEAAARAWAEK